MNAEALEFEEKRDQGVKLMFTNAEWVCVREAAEDCNMYVREYCRLMILCAAGMGGVLEHAHRVVDASHDASTTPELCDSTTLVEVSDE